MNRQQSPLDPIAPQSTPINRQEHKRNIGNQRRTRRRGETAVAFVSHPGRHHRMRRPRLIPESPYAFPLPMLIP
jgi:hypothetical protein